jgi:hypothetical protein
MLFKRYGEVEEVVIVRHTNGPQRGLPKGFAFVTMASQQVWSIDIRLSSHSLTQRRRRGSQPPAPDRLRLTACV